MVETRKRAAAQRQLPTPRDAGSSLKSPQLDAYWAAAPRKRLAAGSRAPRAAGTEGLRQARQRGGSDDPPPLTGLLGSVPQEVRARRARAGTASGRTDCLQLGYFLPRPPPPRPLLHGG
jgi:hypothetical protein